MNVGRPMTTTTTSSSATASPPSPLSPDRTRKKKRTPPWYARLVFADGEIGRGSFGVVRLAQDPADGSLLAVKRLNRLASTKPNTNKRRKTTSRSAFENEVDILERLTNRCKPDILPLIGSWQTRYYWNIAVSYGIGMSPMNKLLDERTFSGTEMADIAWTLISVLRSVHAAGVCHRDIKPSNILLSNIGVGCRLIDFGGGVIDGQPAESVVYGTRPFMDRDTIKLFLTDRDQRRRPTFDAMKAADIYALGLVLLDLLLPGIRFYKRWIIARKSQLTVPAVDKSYPASRHFAAEFDFCGTDDPLRSECTNARDLLISVGGPDLACLLTVVATDRYLPVQI